MVILIIHKDCIDSDNILHKHKMKLHFFLYFFLTVNIFGFPIHQKRNISPSLGLGKICQPNSLIPLSLKPKEDMDVVTNITPSNIFTALTTSYLLFPSIASAASPDWGKIIFIHFCFNEMIQILKQP